MNTKARIATAVAAGYLLGRTKHLKLAIMVGGLIAGQKIPTNARDLSAELQKLIDGNEQLSQMSEQVRGELTNAAKAAAVQVATDRLGRVSDNLRQVGELPGDEVDADEDEAGEDEPAPEEPAKKTPAKKTAKNTAKKTSGTAKKATKSASGSAKTTAKKAPAKKAAKRASSGTGKKTAKKTSSASRTSRRS